MPDLEKIRICFENCDCVTVERKDIFGLLMEGVSLNISTCMNAVIEEYTAERVHLSLKKECFNNKCEVLSPEMSLKDRVWNFKDIVSFHLYYDNGVDKEVCVKWDGDDYTNDLQQAYMERDMLIIEVR